MIRNTFLLFSLLLAAVALPQTSSANHAQVELVSEVEHVRPGEEFTVAAVVTHDIGWHTYWTNPGSEFGLPLTIKPKLPEGFSARVRFATPHQFQSLGVTGFGYEGVAVHLIEITPPAELTDEKVKVDISVRVQTCDDSSCSIPETFPLSVELPVSSQPKVAGAGAAQIEAARKKAPKIDTSLDLSAKADGANLSLTINVPDGVTFESGDVFFYAGKDGLVETDSQSVATEDGALVVTLKSPSGSPGSRWLPLAKSQPDWAFLPAGCS